MRLGTSYSNTTKVISELSEQREAIKSQVKTFFTEVEKWSLQRKPVMLSKIEEEHSFNEGTVEHRQACIEHL